MGGQSSGLGLMLPLLLMMAVMYLFFIKPQKKQQQKAMELKNSLKVGDRVILYSGLVAEIVEIEGENLILQSGPDSTTLEFKNWCVREVIFEDETQYEDDDLQDDEDYEKEVEIDEDDIIVEDDKETEEK